MKELLGAWWRIRAVAGGVLRWSRRARGWKVDRYEDFVGQVRAAAATIERHPHLAGLWHMGRIARIYALNAKMQELLGLTVAEALFIDCMTDELGAIGEVQLGGWTVSFRIELDRRRRSMGRSA